MTAPAPRNHPAEDAHPAPAPAPVAVPDIEAMPIRERDDLVAAVLRFMTDRGYRVTMPPRNLPIMDARPEPVVAPSEAVSEEAVSAAFVAWCGAFGMGSREMLRVALTAALPHLRLVPEDDEDTVRVPRPVVAYGPKHLTENAATADYLREMVKRVNLLQAGSNVTATVRKLLSDAADAVEALGGAR